MGTTSRTITRSKTADAGAAAIVMSISAVTTTVAATPTTTTPEPTRPCFIVQPRTNPASDGPVPKCATPTWQQEGLPSTDSSTQTPPPVSLATPRP